MVKEKNKNIIKKKNKKRKSERRGLTGTPQQLMPITAGGFNYPVYA